MSEIHIRPVRDAGERRVFLTFPWQIYKGDHLWVPPLLPERAKMIDPARGTFFQRGYADFFVAWRGREPVGTICTAEDEAANAKREIKECIIGFFDCIDDYAGAEAMFNHAVEWAKAHDLETLCGPFNLDYEDSYGVLIEGRDRPPAVLCGHTPPYYQGFFERFGFVPARGDNLAYEITPEIASGSLPRLKRLAERIRKKGRVHIRGADLEHWEDEVDRVLPLMNRALSHLPGHTPWRREALQASLAPFRHIVDPELVLFAEIEGEVVGWFPGVPNLNEAFIHANGLRYPWDYIKLWWHMRRPPACLAIKSVLVLPEYWDTGVAVLLFDEMAKRAIPKGYKWFDLSLTSDDNPRTPILADHAGARLYKRYRVYRFFI